MKYDIYFAIRTVLRYAFGLFVFSSSIHNLKFNPFITLMIVVPFLSLMKSWSPFIKGSFQNQAMAPNYYIVALVHLVVGSLLTVSLALSGVGSYGIIVIAQLLRAGVEYDLSFEKYLERLSIDFVMIIIGFILSQSMNEETVFEINCIVLSVIALIRYFRLRQRLANDLNVTRTEVFDHVEG